MGRLLSVLAFGLLAGCAAPASVAPPPGVDVLLNSTQPLLGVGPVTIWVFLPKAVRDCDGGVAVGMIAFSDDGAFSPYGQRGFNDDELHNVTSASAFLLTRLPGDGLDSSARFYPPSGTQSILVTTDGRPVDHVVYTVGNATWHERAPSGWKRMPSTEATLQTPCAKGWD